MTPLERKVEALIESGGTYSHMALVLATGASSGKVAKALRHLGHRVDRVPGGYQRTERAA